METKIEDYLQGNNGDIIFVRPEATVHEAIKAMVEHKIGSVLVISEDEKLQGIFTERDLLTKFLAKDQSLIMEVGDACSYPLVTAPIGINVHDAALIMKTKHIRRLPITKNNKLI